MFSQPVAISSVCIPRVTHAMLASDEENSAEQERSGGNPALSLEPLARLCVVTATLRQNEKSLRFLKVCLPNERAEQARANFVGITRGIIRHR